MKLVCAHLVLMLLLLTPAAAGGDAVSFGPGTVISSSDLPRAMRQDSKRSQTISPRDFDGYLRGLPELILDGAILQVTLDASDNYTGGETISASRIALVNGAKIVTHGIDLVINASVLEVGDGAKLVTFDEPSPRPAATGQSGLSGRAGGTVLLNVSSLKATSPFIVDLSGESGQDGGAGMDGLPGVHGSFGEPSFSPEKLFLRCIRPAGDGGPGGRGGPGGPGGRGGAGGDGGYLILRGAIAKARLDIVFIATGGTGGDGGPGGQGGVGGPGGPGGQRASGCPGGRDGPTGIPGEPGPQGTAGRSGQTGSIRAESTGGGNSR